MMSCHTRVDILPSSRRVRVNWKGCQSPNSTSPRLLFETGGLLRSDGHVQSIHEGSPTVIHGVPVRCMSCPVVVGTHTCIFRTCTQSAR